MSLSEKQEAFEDACEAYGTGVITFQEFVLLLARLGFNATDIADAEKMYRPKPPENEDGD